VVGFVGGRRGRGLGEGVFGCVCLATVSRRVDCGQVGRWRADLWELAGVLSLACLVVS
jgi:hypothetical protein